MSGYANDVTVSHGRDRDFSAVERVLKAFSDAAVLCVGVWAGRTKVPGGFPLCQDGLKILRVVFWREGPPLKKTQDPFHL